MLPKNAKVAQCIDAADKSICLGFQKHSFRIHRELDKFILKFGFTKKYYALLGLWSYLSYDIVFQEDLAFNMNFQSFKTIFERNSFLASLTVYIKTFELVSKK